MIVDPTNATKFDVGSLFTLQNPEFSKDINLTGLTILNDYGTNSITGSSVGVQTAIPNVVETYTHVNFANPNGNGNTTPFTTPSSPYYHLTGYSDDVQYAKFAMDLEYFQVIQSVDVATFVNNASNTLNSFPQRFLLNSNDVFVINGTSPFTYNLRNYSASTCFNDFDKQQIPLLRQVA